mmetsp:Transcript_8894/g.17900  ORF Transcript_8894/g.17900 Transcript_8894/m.17900 type:complete len:250 (-) Transcript_8894:498-1247(-)
MVPRSVDLYLVSVQVSWSGREEEIRLLVDFGREDNAFSVAFSWRFPFSHSVGSAGSSSSFATSLRPNGGTVPRSLPSQPHRRLQLHRAPLHAAPSLIPRAPRQHRRRHARNADVTRQEPRPGEIHPLQRLLLLLQAKGVGIVKLPESHVHAIGIQVDLLGAREGQGVAFAGAFGGGIARLAGGEVGAASVVAELVLARGGRGRGGSSVVGMGARAERVGGTVGEGGDADDGAGGGGGAGEGGIGEVSKG